MLINSFRQCRSIFTSARCASPIGNVGHSGDVNIFDLFLTKKLQRERAARRWFKNILIKLLILVYFRDDVEVYDYIKEEVGFRLSDRLFDIKKELQLGVDLGGGRGYCSKHILAETLQELKVYDISQTMLDQVEGTPGVNLERHLLENEYIDVRWIYWCPQPCLNLLF